MIEKTNIFIIFNVFNAFTMRFNSQVCDWCCVETWWKYANADAFRVNALFHLKGYFLDYNPHHISWDSWDVFCPPNVGLFELASQKQKIQHWEGKSTTFCRYMVFAPVFPT